MFNSAKQKLRMDLNGIYKYTVVGEQVLFILKKSVGNLWIYRGEK